MEINTAYISQITSDTLRGYKETSLTKISSELPLIFLIELTISIIRRPGLKCKRNTKTIKDLYLVIDLKESILQMVLSRMPDK